MALDDLNDILGSKMWKIRIASYKYQDVFGHYFKICDFLAEMKEEVDNIVEQIEKEEEEEEEIGNIEDINHVNEKEEAKQKEKEKLKIFFEEHTIVLNSLETFKYHLDSLPNSLENLADSIDPNHDIEF